MIKFILIEKASFCLVHAEVYMFCTSPKCWHVYMHCLLHVGKTKSEGGLERRLWDLHKTKLLVHIQWGGGGMD